MFPCRLNVSEPEFPVFLRYTDLETVPPGDIELQFMFPASMVQALSEYACKLAVGPGEETLTPEPSLLGLGVELGVGVGVSVAPVVPFAYISIEPKLSVEVTDPNGFESPAV